MDILKKFLIQFLILVIILGGIIFIVTNNQRQIVDGTKLTEGVQIEKGSYIKEPEQKKVSEETINITVGGIKVNMTKLAEYDITGVVLDTERYNDVVGPIDVGLAWGILSEDNNYKNFTSYVVEDRTLTWKSNDSSWMKKMGGEDEISRNCSNNHLVPANDNIRKQLLKIKKDEYIRLTGYLVKLEWRVGNTKHVWGPSSLSRTDSGENACEIIYVQTINFL